MWGGQGKYWMSSSVVLFSTLFLETKSLTELSAHQLINLAD